MLARRRRHRASASSPMRSRRPRFRLRRDAAIRPAVTTSLLPVKRSRPERSARRSEASQNRMAQRTPRTSLRGVRSGHTRRRGTQGSANSQRDPCRSGFGAARRTRSHRHGSGLLPNPRVRDGTCPRHGRSQSWPGNRAPPGVADHSYVAIPIMQSAASGSWKRSSARCSVSAARCRHPDGLARSTAASPKQVSPTPCACGAALRERGGQARPLLVLPSARLVGSCRECCSLCDCDGSQSADPCLSRLLPSNTAVADGGHVVAIGSACLRSSQYALETDRVVPVIVLGPLRAGRAFPLRTAGTRLCVDRISWPAPGRARPGTPASPSPAPGGARRSRCGC